MEAAGLGPVNVEEDSVLKGPVSLVAVIDFAPDMAPEPSETTDLEGLRREGAGAGTDADVDTVVGASDLLGERGSLTGLPLPNPDGLVISVSLSL